MQTTVKVSRVSVLLFEPCILMSSLEVPVAQTFGWACLIHWGTDVTERLVCPE